MVLERLLILATVLVLAAGLPLSVVAIRGFEGAPFRRVVRPVPVVFGAFIALNVPTLADVSVPIVYDAVVSSVAIGASLVVAVECSLLLGGWRDL